EGRLALDTLLTRLRSISVEKLHQLKELVAVQPACHVLRSAGIKPVWRRRQQQQRRRPLGSLPAQLPDYSLGRGIVRGLQQVSEALKLVEDDQVRCQLLDRTCSEGVPEVRDQFQIIEIPNRRHQVLTLAKRELLAHGALES